MVINYSRVYKNSVLVAIAGLLLFAPVEVKGQESLELRVEPEKLTIAGTSGEKIRRTLTITVNQAIAPDNLEISFRDLYSTDELEVFPAAAQTANIQADQKSSLEYKIPLEFDLQESSSKGQFSGNMILRYQQQAGEIATVIRVPITTKIKSKSIFPFLTILLGTGIGMGLSWYSSKGRLRDEILLRAGRLSTWMEKDPQFNQSRGFKSQIEYQLNNVKSAVQEERWEDAEADITSAKIIWQKWNKGKTLLLPQLEYARELEQTLAELNPQQPFKGQILYQITEKVEQAPDLDTIEQLRINLSEIASQINSYHQLQNQLEQVENLWHELAQVFPDGAKKWHPKLEDWKQHFAGLTTNDDLSNLLTELKNAALEINEAIPRGRGNAADQDLPVVTDKLIVEDAPTSIVLDLNQGVQKANWNLKVFAWLSYVLALILLVGTGFNEMYLKNETFGENPFGDYFSLLAWGFGAEASREAIAKAVEGWGLAGLDKQ